MTKKGSILVIIIFIMLLSSIVGLLVTRYIQNMINNSAEFFKFYKSYYMAYAGVELELAKISKHTFGFEDKILSGSSTISKNFHNSNECPSNLCSFEVAVKSRAQAIVNDFDYDYSGGICNDLTGYNFSLWTGQGVIVPLFTDGTPNGENSLFQSVTSNINPISQIGTIKLYTSGSTDVNYIVAIVDNNLDENQYSGSNIIDNQGKTLNEYSLTYSPTDGQKPFLVVANTTGNLNLCIQSDTTNLLPAPYIKIESFGTYMDRQVSIKAIKQNQLPDYLIYGIIDKIQ